MSTRWIALHCGEDAEALLTKHPNAFLLLTQIAMRAQWKDNPITGIKAGEAFIGDYQNAGIQTQKGYRCAKDILVRCGQASFKGASKGTVATLASTSIFSTTAPDKGEQGASRGRAEGEQGATTHTDTQKDGHTEAPLPLAPSEKKSKLKDGRAFSLEAIQFANWFKSSLPESINLQSNWQNIFAKTHDELVRLDRKTPEEIKTVCQWARTDSFWQQQFMSPAKLRKRNGDGITYWDVFTEKMKAPQAQATNVNTGWRQPAKFRGIIENIDPWPDGPG